MTKAATQAHVNPIGAHGIDVGIVMNVIPAWVVDLGLTRPWCFLQDCWNFNNPFK